MKHDLEWNEEFNIGVEIVDKAHRKLFSIVRRILLLTEDEENSKWACIEGIKYFKRYTMEHFQQEEEYMRSINYPGFAVHKQLHDNLRDKTLPILEQNLEKSDYSKEAMEQFLGVCIGWLTGHIMIEDKAITGKVASKWSHEKLESENQTMEQSLLLAMKEVFCQEARIFSDHYGGEDFGKAMTYYFVYAAPDDSRELIIISLDNRLAFSVIEMMLNVSFKKMNQTMSASIGLILQQFLRSIADYFNVSEGTYQLEKSVHVSTLAMQRFFQKQYPKYSILLDTDMGCLAFCSKTIMARRNKKE